MRPRALAALLVGVLLLVAGCARDAGSAATADVAATVDVAGAEGVPPTLTYTTPLSVPEAAQRTVWPGTGDVLQEGGPALLNLYAQDGRDGSLLQSTFADAPQWLTFSAESLGSGLHAALQGQRVGARVLYVDEEDGVPLVLVVDVLPTRAAGEEVPAVDGLPTVTRDADGAPAVTVPAETAPPQDLVVQPLVRGTGAQVEIGQVVTVRFTGVAWSSGQVVDTTWTDGTPPQAPMIGIGQVVEGWDQGLLEQTVGSQVLLVVPPSLAYGGTDSPLADETLVYVVDILDAHLPVADEADPADGGDAGTAPDATEPSPNEG